MRFQFSIKLLLSTIVVLGVSSWSLSETAVGSGADAITVGKIIPPNADRFDLALNHSDFSRQVYIKQGGGKVLAFDGNSRGIEYSNGEAINGPYEIDFSWSIDPKNNLMLEYGAEESVSAALKGVSGNEVTLDAVESGDGIHETVVLYKALPLSLEDLDGEILSTDVSDNPDCSAVTLAFKSGLVSLSEACDDGFTVTAGKFKKHDDYDNLIVVTFQDFSLLFALVDGDINDSARFANVIFDGNGFIDYVDFLDVTNVENEVLDPSLIYI